MKTNMKKWIAAQIASGQRISIPIMTLPGIEMIGKSVKDAVQSGDVHAQAIRKLAEVFPSAATTVIMDLTLEAEAFGCRIDFQENDMPHILGRLVSSAEEIEMLKVPDLLRLPPSLITIMTDTKGSCHRQLPQQVEHGRRFIEGFLIFFFHHRIINDSAARPKADDAP